MSVHIASKKQTDEATELGDFLVAFATNQMCDRLGLSPLSAIAVIVQVALADLRMIGGDDAGAFIAAIETTASAKTDREKKKGMAAMSEAFSRMVSVFEAQVELQRAGGLQ